MTSERQEDDGVPLELVLNRLQGKMGAAMASLSALEVNVELERHRADQAEQRCRMLEARLRELENSG